MTLVLEGLSKAYAPGRPVFQGLNLTFGDRRTALVGPSGCGKTTLLRVLAGLIEPDAGTVNLDGRVIGRPGYPVEAWKVGIGLVFQEGALFPHLSVERNVAFALGKGDDRARAREMIALVGLAGLEGRYPHELSGGQQQRVALARALVPQPGFLLLDEPFSGLDTRTKRGLMDDLEALFDRLGTNVILVTHDEDDAGRLASRIVEL